MLTTSEKGDCCWKFRRLCRVWKIITREPKTPFGDPCVRFPGHVIRGPDPCIYSQFFLMQLKQPVTWDNPDVRILNGGVEQNSYDLRAGTDYTLEITVHNSSRDKPANNTAVNVRWIEFGAGGQTRHAIATLSADVPVWPGTAVVQAAWRTPQIPGHYCIEVELVHPDDSNPANNRGWNNTQVHAATSPIRRPIRIFNQYPNGCPPVREGGGPYLRPERAFLGWGTLGAVTGGFLYRVGPEVAGPFVKLLMTAAFGYVALVVIGLIAEAIYTWIRRTRRETFGKRPPKHERTPCNLVEIEVDGYEFQDEVGKRFRPEMAFQGKAASWQAHVEPSGFMFGDREVFRDVELIVEAPDGPGSPGVFNVNVRQGGAPIGGVTITVTRGAA